MHHKGYHCLDPSTSRVDVTRHAQFDEFFFPFAQQTGSTPLKDLDYMSFIEPPNVVETNTHNPPSSHTSLGPCANCYNSSLNHLLCFSSSTLLLTPPTISSAAPPSIPPVVPDPATPIEPAVLDSP